VVELEPGNSNAYAYWGAALGQLNRHSRAIEKLEHALEIQPSNPNVFNILVDSLFHLKKYSEAWGAVKRARKMKVTISKNSINRLIEVFPEPTG
ncbi:uncharacterized protein METZ01_LOCUS505642, partial [marine metagenome]